MKKRVIMTRRVD